MLPTVSMSIRSYTFLVCVPVMRSMMTSSVCVSFLYLLLCPTLHRLSGRPHCCLYTRESVYVSSYLPALGRLILTVSLDSPAGMREHPPISISELADHIERLKANDGLRFSQEYEVRGRCGGAGGPLMSLRHRPRCVLASQHALSHMPGLAAEGPRADRSPSATGLAATFAAVSAEHQRAICYQHIKGRNCTAETVILWKCC